jgi:hypothetical protein
MTHSRQSGRRFVARMEKQATIESSTDRFICRTRIHRAPSGWRRQGLKLLVDLLSGVDEWSGDDWNIWADSLQK